MTKMLYGATATAFALIGLGTYLGFQQAPLSPMERSYLEMRQAKATLEAANADSAAVLADADRVSADVDWALNKDPARNLGL